MIFKKILRWPDWKLREFFSSSREKNRKSVKESFYSDSFYTDLLIYTNFKVTYWLKLHGEFCPCLKKKES